MESMKAHAPTPSAKVLQLVSRMSVAEKVGQLCLVNGAEGEIPPNLARDVAVGAVGGILNEVKPETVAHLQALATGSRLGIPLLMGRDVIHGFRTVFPIPLGQAASWDPDCVEQCAALAAREAAACGLNWTFAPMLDLGRDPRWGRVAESLGEDPLLISVLGAAMVRGFQHNGVAACAKHFAGYGASEGGRDYNSCAIPEMELRQVHFPPFQAALAEGVATVMASFSDLSGVPASANAFLLSQVLRGEWAFPGFVVSDWESVGQLTQHGVAEDERHAALLAATAGVDMEMAGCTFQQHLATLVVDGALSEERLNVMVAAVLTVKERLGLLDGTWPRQAAPNHDQLRACAHRSALESVVLLKNERNLLPLDRSRLHRVAVIGPMADEPAEQLGTWVFDGDPALSVTPLQALRQWENGKFQIQHHRALSTTRDKTLLHGEEAIKMAAEAEVVLLFLGEEAILSGEAHCRADIRLPGAQEELLRRVVATGTPTVAVIMAGRPLALGEVEELPAALLYAWHPGTQAGPALRDLLFGLDSPSGKLPVSLPRTNGHFPLHYSHKATGRPADPATFLHLDDIPRGARQHSLGNTSHYLDAGYTPLFPFGHGLGYTSFAYRHLRLSTAVMRAGEPLELRVQVSNTGARDGTEVVQLYLRDLVASVTRPVKELKAFQRVFLRAGESQELTFILTEADLRFVGADMRWRSEPGAFRLWVGGSSQGGLEADFTLA